MFSPTFFLQSLQSECKNAKTECLNFRPSDWLIFFRSFFYASFTPMLSSIGRLVPHSVKNLHLKF
jgi:hypothetical protein